MGDLYYMRCKYCKGNIGFWRGLSDREFCSEDHRRRSRAATARAARESVIYGDEELYAIVSSEQRQKQKHSKLQAQIIVVLSTVMIGVLAFSAATGSVGSSGINTKSVSLTGELSKGSPILSQASQYIRNWIPANTPVKIHEDFRAGFASWVGSRAGDWKVDDGLMRPGSLRLWQPSLRLADYRMEFEGQIERNAMSWAFRAPDVRNYYATKIVVKRSNGLPVADIVRYAVLNGVERERQRLPLPMSIRQDTLYHVQMSVRGNHFTTRVNGQVVDTWTDNRLKRGGVGFFSERGESASIHWVDVREERDSILSRLFAMGLIVSPLAYYE
jgi:hypothetical protein